MTLKLNGSSSGSVSIDAPASTTGGADVTFALPVADGSAGQVLSTDGSGNLSWTDVSANTPNFHAHGTQDLSSSAWYDLICGTESFDTDSGYNTSTGAFTVPSGKGGKYHFYATYEVPYMDDGEMCTILIDLNGSTVSHSVNNFYGSKADMNCNPQTSVLLDLSAGDVVKPRYWHNEGGTQTSVRQSFYGWRIT